MGFQVPQGENSLGKTQNYGEIKEQGNKPRFGEVGSRIYLECRRERESFWENTEGESCMDNVVSGQEWY